MSWNRISYISPDIIAVKWPEHVACRSVKKNVYQWKTWKTVKVRPRDISKDNIKVDHGKGNCEPKCIYFRHHNVCIVMFQSFSHHEVCPSPSSPFRTLTLANVYSVYILCCPFDILGFKVIVCVLVKMFNIQIIKFFWNVS
jgi:hypothetical protein